MDRWWPPNELNSHGPEALNFSKPSYPSGLLASFWELGPVPGLGVVKSAKVSLEWACWFRACLGSRIVGLGLQALRFGTAKHEHIDGRDVWSEWNRHARTVQYPGSVLLR